jgi:hypothetical protein
MYSNEHNIIYTQNDKINDNQQILYSSLSQAEQANGWVIGVRRV